MAYTKHFPEVPNTDEKYTNYVDGTTVLTAEHMSKIRDAIQADETYLAEVDPKITSLENAKDNVVLVQSTQPASEDNKIWIPTTQGQEVEVPTYDEFTDLKSAFEKIASVEEIDAVQRIGYYVSDGRYVGRQATSCIFVIDLTNIESNSELGIEITGTANRCRFLFSQTLAADVGVATGGEYIDYGNDIRSVSIPYATWSQYNTIVVCTNHQTGEPYATVSVTGGNVSIKVAAIPDDSITPNKCTFFKKCEQLLKAVSSSDGFWNINASGGAAKSSSTGAHAYEPFKLFAGVTYRFINMYGYFSLVANLDGSNASRVTDSQTNSWSGYYTPENDCYLFASVHNNYYGTTGVVLNDTQYVPSEYMEGVYYTYFIGNTKNKVVDVHVKTDGTGDYTSVVDAVNFANAQKGNFPINIYIHTGDYNILEELGGDDFLATVDESVDERQGLVLKADNINLIGVGLVTLRYELADNVTYNQSARTSCLNLREFSNRVENLTLIARNCRYTIHDETNGGNPYIHRLMKNLRCIHKGNASGLWPYPTVMGGGAGGGSTYDVINCQFITSSYFQAFSYHSGANQEASMFNIDGCVGSVKDDAPTKISFRLSYHGTGRTGISVGNIKNCSGNGQTVVQPESSGDTDNNIEMYVNGWETIDPIAVTGIE